MEHEIPTCHVISARGAPVHVYIGTKKEAQGKLTALVNAAYRALPKEELESLLAAARAANYLSVTTFMKHFQRWTATEVPCTGVKP